MVHGRGRVARMALSLLAAANLLLLSDAVAQIERTHRDEWQKVDEIFSALDLEAGDWVADVGSGRGFFTLRLALKVGPRGRVFAVDISDTVLRELRAEVRRASLNNVEVILGQRDDPRLPDSSLDAALIVIAYHEMEQHEAMLAGIRQALRPGARLVIVDNPARDPTLSRRRQMQRHHIDIQLVEQDVEAAGFEVIERAPHFVDVNDGRHTHRNWMLVAARPVENRTRRAALRRVRGATLGRVHRRRSHRTFCG